MALPFFVFYVLHFLILPLLPRRWGAGEGGGQRPAAPGLPVKDGFRFSVKKAVFGMNKKGRKRGFSVKTRGGEAPGGRDGVSPPSGPPRSFPGRFQCGVPDVPFNSSCRGATLSPPPESAPFPLTPSHQGRGRDIFGFYRKQKTENRKLRRGKVPGFPGGPGP